MAYELYEKVHEIWKDKPDKTTPVLGEDLMHIEQGIYDNSVNIKNLQESGVPISGVLDESKSEVIRVNLANLTWKKSYGGIYYAEIDDFTAENKILSATLGTWANISNDIFIAPYIVEDNKKLAFICNKNSFSSNSYIYVHLLYTDELETPETLDIDFSNYFT